MKTVFCIHSDAFTADALAQTLNAAALGFQALPQAAKAQNGASEGIFLSDALYDLSPARTVLMGTGPVRLKTLAEQVLRKLNQIQSPKEITFGAYKLDLMTRDFFKAEIAIALTEKEAAILLHLFQNGPATRDDLLRDVWQYANGVDTHTIETHIYRLRQKIETNPENPDILITTKDGYALAATSSA